MTPGMKIYTYMPKYPKVILLGRIFIEEINFRYLFPYLKSGNTTQTKMQSYSDPKLPKEKS